MGRARALAVGGVVGVVAMLGSASAASGGGIGCPAYGNPGGNPGTRDLELMTVQAAVDRTVAQITDAWYASQGTTKAQVVADRTASMTALDQSGNADGRLCVAEKWGSELNPNSNWATYWGDLLDPPEVQVFVVTDNHRGTSNNS